MATNWREWFKSSYTRFLEQEVERLRSEVRRLMDAALESKGLPPITKPAPSEPVHMRQRLTPSQFKRKMEEMSGKVNDAQN
jgi:hypothetical protein